MLEDFYLTWQPFWACDLERLVIFMLSHLMDDLYELTSFGFVVSETCLYILMALKYERPWLKCQGLALEMPRPIPLNYVESDLECTSRIYFDNMTLESKNKCQNNNKCDCSKTKKRL